MKIVSENMKVTITYYRDLDKDNVNKKKDKEKKHG